MLIYEKIINGIMKFVEVVCMALLAITVVIISCQVIWRYVLNAPLAWTEELSRYLFIWIVMLGIPIMFNRNIAICFDLFSSKFKGRAHEVLEIVFKLLGLFFCIVYCMYSISLCVKTGNRCTSGLEIPLNLLYSAQPVSAILTGLIMIKQVMEEIQKGVKKEC